ncbi:MAG: ComEC/Rec2 family competence protein [Oscillospiraceae bacterium]|nr:ComEC/Rec2 family competence protein [Oscillospiraceae bacterium]
MKQQAGSGACLHGVECFTFAWIAGLLAAFLHELPYALLLGLFGLLAALRLSKRERLYLILGAVLGAACWLRYDFTVRQPLCNMDGIAVRCTGVITDTALSQRSGMIYTLQTELAGKRASVDWYAAEDTPLLQIGDRVTLDAVLTRIQPDYRFRTAAYESGRGRYLRIYEGRLTDSAQDSGFSLRRVLHSYRQRIRQCIVRAVPQEEAALLCTMIFGEKTELAYETAENLNHIGIGHITAVSGLHLVFFCGILNWLLRRLHCAARTICLLHIPAIALFIMLVDPSVSVYRAAVMVMLSQSAALFGRRGDPLRALCIAAFCCTVLTPYVIGSVSFWLSVSGVFGIAVLAPFLTKDLQCGRTAKGFLGLCCVSAAVFPASLLLCGESSLLAPIANLLLLPLCTAALCIGFLLLLTGGLTAFLLPAAGMICRFVLAAAKLLDSLPFSHTTQHSAPVRLAVILLTGWLLLLFIRKVSPRTAAGAVLAAAVLLSVLSVFDAVQDAAQLRVAVLGGKKQAVLVLSVQGSTVIADLTDDPRNAQYVRRYLRDAGIVSVDALLLSGMKSAASYQTMLSGRTVGAVIMQNGTAWRNDASLCDKPVIFAGDAPVSAQCGNALLLCGQDGTQIKWQNMQLAVLPEQAAATSAEAVIRYGGAECTAAFPAAGETESGSNFLLRLTKDGRGSVTPLQTDSIF